MRLVISAISSTGRPTTEALESAQFGNLEVRVGDIALVVQEDFDLAVTFQAGDGINCDSLCHCFLQG